jgi:hypothetical protein
MPRTCLPLLTLAALCVLLSSSAKHCWAGILVPPQVSFDANDLERAIEQGASEQGASRSSDGTSSSSRRVSHDWPADESDQPTSPLELANSLPTGTTSSSTTSSSPGGAIGSGAVQCVLNSTLTLQDDSPLGTLAEDHGFSLPDPPGTDLLRPPRG